MKRKLKPIVGALVVGLIGVAQATCYYETSFVCLTANTLVGSISSGNCFAWIYSYTDWYGWNLNTAQSGYDKQTTPITCEGKAYYDWCDGHRYFIHSNDGSGVQYYRVNYNSPCPPP